MREIVRVCVRLVVAAGLFVVVVVTAPPTAELSAQDANGGFESVLWNGPATNRVDLAVVGVDYSQSDWEDAVDGLASSFWWDDPLQRYHGFFNLHRIDEELPDPASVSGGATWNGINSTAARQTAEAVLGPAGIDLDVGLGILAGSPAGNANPTLWAMVRHNSFSSTQAANIVQHELAHSWLLLADEYWYPGEDSWPGGEPPQWNVTEDSSGAKWDRWIGYLDPDLPAWASVGAVGVFEGGMRNEFGIYRSTFTSRMRSTNQPWNAIMRERLIERIYAEVDPLDAHSDNTNPVSVDAVLSVAPVDVDVIKVEWFVDGVLVSGADATSFDLRANGVGYGATVTARAYDEVLDFAYSGASLDWYRLDDTSALEQFVDWQIDAAPEGLGVDGDVNCDARVSIVDALWIAQFAVGARSDGLGCPLASFDFELVVSAGDVDGDGVTTIVDALAIAQCEVGIDNGHCSS